MLDTLNSKTPLPQTKHNFRMQKGHEHYETSGGGDNSKQLMKEFLDTLTIEGYTVDIEPTQSHSWDTPYETAHGVPDGNRKFTVTQVMIDVDDWLELQKEAHNSSSWDSFRKGATEKTINRVAEDIENGTTGSIPTPVLEISHENELDYYEGRSRGYGAKKAGLDKMPLWIAVRDYY